MDRGSSCERTARSFFFPDCYITLLWGPPCSVPAVYSEVPPAFPAQLLHSAQMSEGAAEDTVWGGAREAGVVSGPRCSGCLSQVNMCVCAHRPGKEGHTHAHTQQKEREKKLRQRSSSGSCGFQSANDAGQLERADWSSRTRRACPGRGSLPLTAPERERVTIHQRQDVQ